MSRRPPETPPALEKRPQPGRLRAIFLAIAVHAAFFALIVFGVTWQNKPAAPVEAELWEKLPPAPSAEPKPAPPEPKVEPKPPRVEPKPEPRPEPKRERLEPPKPDALSLKLEREKKEREKKEKLEQRKAEEARKREQEDAAKKKREQEEIAKKKREQQEEAARKKAEDERRRKEEQAAREAAERAAQQAASARQAEVDRFKSEIQRKIRNRANVPDTVTGKPELIVRIKVLPGGEVLDITITKRSGNPAYDAAIERGIRSASPLPVPPADSELFPQFRELNLRFQHER